VVSKETMILKRSLANKSSFMSWTML